MTYLVPFGRHVLSVREKECLSFGETAERFSVGIASIKRWAKRIAPRPRERRKVRKIDPEKLAREVIDHPAACQYDRAARFDVTPKAIWQALGKPGVTYKQALTPPKADQDARQGFREKGVSEKD